MNPSTTSREATLVCELLDDCVFAESSASDGGLTSLRYIPASASTFGATAARLYPELRKTGRSDEIWQLFHADQVRFGNAYPLKSSHPAWPAPCTWQVEKDRSLYEPTNGLLLASLLNASAEEPARGAQRKPLRAHFVAPDGHFFQPATSVQLKAAFNPQKGTAAEGQLFQYQALTAVRYLRPPSAAIVMFRNGMLRSAFVPTLDRSVLRVESLQRSAVWSRCASAHFAYPPTDGRYPMNGGKATNDAQSDTLVCIRPLSPRRIPAAHHPPNGRVRWRDLPQGFQLNTSHSYIQTRRYSPYNSYRRGHDCERLVISAGSVLTLDWQLPNDPPLNVTQLRDQIGDWIGQHTGTGLGQVVVQPAWAVQPTIQRDSLRVAPNAQPISAAPPQQLVETLQPTQSQWLEWVKQRSGQAEVHNQAAQWANGKLSEVRKICLMAATLVPGGREAVTPSASQWGRVLEECRKRPTDASALRDSLADNNGVLRRSRRRPCFAKSRLAQEEPALVLPGAACSQSLSGQPASLHHHAGRLVA